MWSKKLTEEIKNNDNRFDRYLKKKGVNPFSQEAAKEWRERGFRKKQAEIFKKYRK